MRMHTNDGGCRATYPFYPALCGHHLPRLGELQQAPGGNRAGSSGDHRLQPDNLCRRQVGRRQAEGRPYRARKSCKGRKHAWPARLRRRAAGQATQGPSPHHRPESGERGLRNLAEWQVLEDRGFCGQIKAHCTEVSLAFIEKRPARKRAGRFNLNN